METRPLKYYFTAGTRGSFLSFLGIFPDLPQPQKCLPVTAVDRHQGNMIKVTKKVYIERIEDPGGLATRQRSVVRVAAEWV
jgi:hypothetical protein